MMQEQEINAIFIDCNKMAIGTSFVIDLLVEAKTKVAKLIDRAVSQNPYVQRKYNACGVKVFKLSKAHQASAVTPELLAKIQLEGQDRITNKQLATKRLYAGDLLAKAGPWADTEIDVLIQVVLGDSSESDSSEQCVKRRRTHGRASADEREDGQGDNNGPDHKKEFAILDNKIIRREKTVTALYNRLKAYHFITVRGTPASGKSTLAELLARHIRAEHPDVTIIRQGPWTPYKAPETYLTKLRSLGYDAGSKIDCYLIFDDAQTTYWDLELWNDVFKSMTPSSQHYIILFASYGSQSRRFSTEPTPATPEVVSKLHRIGLRHPGRNHDQDAVGLLLTKEEFHELIRRKFRGARFNHDFVEWLENITAGHVGALDVLVTNIMLNSSYANLKHNATYSIATFRTGFTRIAFWDVIQSSTGAFGRGLPPLDSLQDPDLARVFRAVLINHHITAQELAKEDRPTLTTCFQQGWLHAATKLDSSPEKYVFASPLHQLYIEHFLGSKSPRLPEIEGMSLLDFVINVIKRFSHVKLNSERRLGTSEIQRPPEAQYQDEFYRACHTYAPIVTFPEFGGAHGKIDFYIPSKSWGVEVLRDGNRLEQHLSRFLTGGCYSSMSFTQFIILDFRKTLPQKPHPEMFKLYHVVFDDDYSQAQILRATTLELISKFALLA